MRTLTLMFFAAASLLLGAAAMPAALVAIAAYQGGGSLPAGVYGYFVAIVALSAPAAFFAAAVATALRREDSRDPEPTGPEPEALAAIAAILGDAPRGDPDAKYRPRR